MELCQYADGQDCCQACEQSQGTVALWAGRLSKDILCCQAESFAAWDSEASQEGADGYVYHDVRLAVRRSNQHDEREEQQKHQESVRRKHCGNCKQQSEQIEHTDYVVLNRGWASLMVGHNGFLNVTEGQEYQHVECFSDPPHRRKNILRGV